MTTGSSSGFSSVFAAAIVERGAKWLGPPRLGPKKLTGGTNYLSLHPRVSRFHLSSVHCSGSAAVALVHCSGSAACIPGLAPDAAVEPLFSRAPAMTCDAADQPLFFFLFRTPLALNSCAVGRLGRGTKRARDAWTGHKGFRCAGQRKSLAPRGFAS